jgi:Iap family predicted aminopeptidase
VDPSAPDYVSPPPAPAGRGGGRGANPDAQRIARVLRESGAGVLLRPSIGEHGTVFVTGRDTPGAAPSIVLSAEHYNMIARMIERQVPVKLRVNVQATFNAGDGHAYNVLAELPGTDPALKDEVVMIGGHLDSWHTGVGATDNADGATTVIEAMRILKAIGVRPRRTIRVALWGGEEEGLFGSKAWVDAHLTGDAHAAERARFDVYFNIDPGYGPIYGWFLERNDAARAIFDEWLEPLKAMGARRNVIEGIGNTDHLSFIAAGVPGFNPIQSYEGYDVRMHHTNADTPERLKVDDIKQSAIAMAWFAYNAAMADRKIPSGAAAPDRPGR